VHSTPPAVTGSGTVGVVGGSGGGGPGGRGAGDYGSGDGDGTAAVAARGPGAGLAIADRFPYSYAVVDVEGSGLRARKDRVLSIAVVLLGPDGTAEGGWSTLLDPGCDPGPVHIHGLTRERLAGSPTFCQVFDQLAEMLAGRVLVAHNARYDWQMLASEAMRAGRSLTVEQRLCTWVLSRGLGLPVRDLKLATLAEHWGVAQTRPHDAADDAAVLALLLPRLLGVAAEQELELPLASCAGEIVAPFPGRGPRVPCAYVNPGRLDAVNSERPGAMSSERPGAVCTVGAALVQGMVTVFTGPSRMTREWLETAATDAGLKVTDRVSGSTSVLVTNDVSSGSRKARAALAREIPVVDEETFLRLLADVRPGVPRPQTVATDVDPPAAEPRAPLASSPAAARKPDTLAAAADRKPPTGRRRARPHEATAQPRVRVLRARHAEEDPGAGAGAGAGAVDAGVAGSAAAGR